MLPHLLSPRVAAWRKNNTLHQPTESFATPLPCGFALKLVILTSWGDPHYVGLVGLEVLDAARGVVLTDPSQLLAGEPGLLPHDILPQSSIC